MFALAISSGFVIGALVAFPSSQRIMKQTQFDRQRPDSPQELWESHLAQPELQTRVAGVIESVDRDRRQIRIRALSPYPDGEHARMTFTYSTSTAIATVSTEFTQRIETDIGTPQVGARIMIIMPRREGNLRADKISFLP